VVARWDTAQAIPTSPAQAETPPRHSLPPLLHCPRGLEATAATVGRCARTPKRGWQAGSIATVKVPRKRRIQSEGHPRQPRYWPPHCRQAPTRDPRPLQLRVKSPCHQQSGVSAVKPSFRRRCARSAGASSRRPTFTRLPYILPVCASTSYVRVYANARDPASFAQQWRREEQWGSRKGDQGGGKEGEGAFGATHYSTQLISSARRSGIACAASVAAAALSAALTRSPWYCCRVAPKRGRAGGGRGSPPFGAAARARRGTHSGARAREVQEPRGRPALVPLPADRREAPPVWMAVCCVRFAIFSAHLSR